ncbi:hypothetical protein CC80DRAFT_483394 [Byssothecium circinans]|uniref:Potassium channel tetramerisation-type BTB domain-containing protein n=1 Tax=Byssothecium circinans TaxID=147558 RepID=A0A6A5TE67_9PLEO|nr:hypothetical protein CC80DRAFT_483394 [Byssothecium circinans]
MPNPPGQNPPPPRDFAFQSIDQSLARFGGAEGAAHPYLSQPDEQRYETERSTNALDGSNTISNQAPTHVDDPFMTYPEVGAQQQQSSVPPQGNSGPYSNYGFSPGAVTWDWGSTVDFPDYYEPQGELVQELQNQNIPTNEFSMPMPVTNPEIAYQSPQQFANAPPTIVQNPLSPPPKPPQRPSIQTGMAAKRKADSEPRSAVSRTGSVPAVPEQRPAKRPNIPRSPSSASATSPVVATATASESHHPPSLTASSSAPEATETAPPNTSAEIQKRKETSKGTGPQGRVIDVSRPRRVVESAGGGDVLPAGKVFPIQIGSELFRLSGASISSDAPSYFSHFFGEQIHSNQGRADDIRTLYIDRDPDTFRDIAAHLQGYHITPRDGEHFVRLFADVQFYSLPRLTKQLFSTDIFVRIGGVPFQIPRDLFSSPGDSPNYFSLGFAQFFSTPSEVFPGLDRNALLRPPSISPPSVPNRSGETFKELVKILQGYTVDIRSEAHRAELLRDARYFNLRGLEQKLIPCEISYNLRRNQSEILIRLEDIRQSGVSFTADAPINSASGSGSSAPSNSGVSEGANSPATTLGGPQYVPGTVCYARPYTDDNAHTNILILEISSAESTTLHFPIDAPHVNSSSEPLTLDLRATFHGSTLARITSLFSVIASKMGLPATQPLGLMMLQSGGGVAAQPVSPANSGVSERRVRIRIASDCALDLDSMPAELAVDPDSKRLGIRRIITERRHERIRVSEAQGVYEENGDDARNEWIWGGGRDADVRMKDGEEVEEEIVVRRAHWRLRVEVVGDGQEREKRMQVVLCGVRIEGRVGERSRNAEREFLGRA